MWNLKSNSNNPFFVNMGKKTLAIVIAIALWIVANLEFDIERNVEVPINFSNLDESLVIVNDVPEKVSLRARGPRSELSNFADSNLNINFDLATVQKGSSKIDVQTEQLSVPEEVQIVTISPGEFVLDVDSIVSKSVEIKPRIGNPDQGVEISGSPLIIPSEVVISGPERILSTIDSVYTSRISLNGESSKFTIQVPLQMPSPLVKTEKEELARVTVDLNTVILEKEFKNIEINLKNFNEIKYEIDSNLRADIIFNGPYNIINSLKSDDIDVFLDGSTINKDKKEAETLKVNVNYPYPDSLKLTKISPKTVKIKVN